MLGLVLYREEEGVIASIVKPLQMARGDRVIKNVRKNGNVFENDFAYIKFSNSPDKEGRIDVVLKKKSLSDMTEEERENLFKLIDECKEYLNKKFDSDGYEINISLEKHSEKKPKNLCISLAPGFE